MCLLPEQSRQLQILSKTKSLFISYVTPDGGCKWHLETTPEIEIDV